MAQPRYIGMLAKSLSLLTRHTTLRWFPRRRFLVSIGGTRPNVIHHQLCTRCLGGPGGVPQWGDAEDSAHHLV
jgi:hypothetical protein